ncbi:MAG TPA: LysR family transcriptional regulator [Ramlibacter sp.]|nr:LysR family transcriptional regulator [Ramlibacter sp.]
MSEGAIELRLWRQFLALAEELHFGRAAQRLHITQPPLTQAIALLEDRLGVRLFDRTKRSVNLTPAGAALVPEARDLLARAAALPSHARAAAHGEIGRLRIAFVSTVGFGLLPRWVRGFRAQHPQVEFELIEATGDVQMAAFERGGIDAGFIIHSPGFAPPSMEHLRVGREALVAAIPAQHALARSRSLKLEPLLAEPLVIFPRRIVPSLHDAIFGVYHAHARAPQVAQEAIQMQTIVNLVAAGLGVAWVPDSVREFQRAGVTYRAVPRMPSCETSLIWPAARTPPALERFLAYARQQLRARG